MTDQQKVQLLPCPFCGGQPMRGSSYDEDVLLHNIRCRCGAGVNDFFGPEEAIDAWNARQAEDAQRLDRLQSLVDSGQRVEFAKSLLGNGVEIGVRFPCRAIVADSLREAIDQALAAERGEA